MDLAELADRLRTRRAAVASEFDRMTAPPEPGATVGFGKRIGDGTTEAVERITSTATARSLAASLADIDRALMKLDDGSYGRCDDCGEEIPAARLAAMPATALCVGCKAKRS
jgi:DnaK suppressor protein